MTRPTSPPTGMNRRGWLTALAWSTSTALLNLDAIAAPLSVDPAEVDSAKLRAREAKLADVQQSESGHFIALGDAPEAYRAEALDVCEAIARTFRTHFVTKSIDLSPQGHKLVVVVLANRASYEAFKGDEVDDFEGGYYEVGSNRLVTYDFRGGKGSTATNREINTFTMVHETIHLLAYNSGILRREADIPVAISEGFATYGEIWRLRRPVFGKVNVPRLGVLKHPEGSLKWIPMAQLIADDRLFEAEETSQLAYAESWLLIYDLLQTTAGTGKLQAYLDDVNMQKDPGKRIDVAERSLGNLRRLDSDLKRAASRLR